MRLENHRSDILMRHSGQKSPVGLPPKLQHVRSELHCVAPTERAWMPPMQWLTMQQEQELADAIMMLHRVGYDVTPSMT